MKYTNSQMRELSNEHIHSERNREILCRRLIDDIGYEILGMEFRLSSRQIKNIVSKGIAELFEHIPGD